MGGAESVIKNTDKRTSRREHAPTFKAAIHRFREQYGHAEGDAEVAFGQQGVPSGIRVCVRKRPIFPHEQKGQEYDVITVPPGQDDGCFVAIHDARMEADLIKMFMNHHTFKFDAVFSEKCTNDDVYNSTARLLVRNSTRGLQSTIMMYGQTGSGKTYTMTALQERAFPDIFASAPNAMITVSFVELVGDKCHDMLNVGTQINLTTGTDGGSYPYPCVEVEVENAMELMQLVTHANSLRATAATGVHDHSSRSHAICRVYINEPGTPEGVLTLVDLAGTEHRIDSDEHNAERRKEGALINASLSSLKECIRANAAGASFVQYRNNRLTQLLKTCFDGGKHSTIIIATISPSCKDTEHSLNTLRHACIMDGQGNGQAAGSSHITGGNTVKEKLGSVDVTALGKAKFEARQKQRQRAKQGIAEPAPAPVSKAPPAHQGKQSNAAVRGHLDKSGMSSFDRRLKNKVLSARDSSNLRDNVLQKKRIMGAGAVGPAVPEKRRSVNVPGLKKQAPKKKPANPRERERPPFQVDTPEEAYGYDAYDYPVVEDNSPVPMPEMVAPRQISTPAPKQFSAPVSNPAPTPPKDARPDVMIDDMLTSQKSEAKELWEEFKLRGRRSRQWRKNDLRLIATHIMPTLPEHLRPHSITWMSPEMALDELADVVERVAADNGGGGCDEDMEQQRDWKQEAAKMKREKLNRERQSHLEAKVSSKHNVQSMLREELNALQARLDEGGSTAAQHGIRRQIEIKKARLMRHEKPAKPDPPAPPREARVTPHREVREATRDIRDENVQNGPRLSSAPACLTPQKDDEYEPLGGAPVNTTRARGKRRQAPPSDTITGILPADGSPPQSQGRLSHAHHQQLQHQYHHQRPSVQPLQQPVHQPAPFRSSAPSLPRVTDPYPDSPLAATYTQHPKYGRRVGSGPVGAAAAPWGNFFTEESCGDL